jgi:hypothetical protein
VRSKGFRTTVDTILWRRLDLPGHEVGTLVSTSNGWQLLGTVVFAHDRVPCTLSYVVSCDTRWRTNAAHVSGAFGEREIELNVSVDRARRWRLNGIECPAVEGCLDIDLGFSPSTNLLPIRRLELAVGQQAEVKAAWLPFPLFRFELLQQIYRRETEGSYRYESDGGAFVRILDVNAAGFVRSYPGLWVEER